jgi:hypothetical protein
VVAIFCLRFEISATGRVAAPIAMFARPYSGRPANTRASVRTSANVLHHMIEVVRQPMLGKVAAPVSYLICAFAAVAGGFAYWLLRASAIGRVLVLRSRSADVRDCSTESE